MGRLHAVTWLLVLLLLSSPFLGMFVPKVLADSSNWWNTGFSYRMKITLNNSVVSENLANFPVPVVLSSSQTSFWSHVNRTTGSDVRFVDADNTSELYFEVEQFNATTNATTMWVKVPQIDSASATDFIWLYYGNGTTAFDSYCSSSNSWDSSYKTVWHLNETTGNYNDATTNANHFTTVSGVGRTASPKLGNYGPTWDGANDYLSAAHSASINFTTVLTIEEWINTDDVTLEQAIISKNGQSDDHGWNNELYDANNIHIQDGEASSTMEYTTTDALASNNVWYHCSWVLNMTATNVAIAYVNGVAQATTGTMTTWVDTGYTLYLGISHPVSTYLYPYDGEIDEVRLSNTVRSPKWILACYQYQVDQTKFTFASEDTYIASGQDLTFTSSQTVTAFSSGVSGRELAFSSGNGLSLFSNGVGLSEFGFLQCQTLNVFGTNGLLKEHVFSLSQTVLTFGNGVASVMLGFTSHVTAYLFGDSGTSKGSGFSSSQSLLLYPFNSLGKEQGFVQSQVSNVYSGNVFSKELGFLSGQSLNVFGNSLFNKELAFLSGQTVNVFSSLASNSAFGFQSTSTLNPFSNVLFGKELGFSQSQSLLLLDWSSMGREGAFNVFDFMLGGTADLFDGLGFGKEQAYSPMQTLLSYSSGGVGKELGFFNGGVVNVFGAGLLGRELGFLNGQTLVLFGHNVFGGLGGVPSALFELWGRGSEVMGKELGFSNAPVLWLLDWGYGGGARAFTFNVSPLLRLYDSAGLMKELLFRPSALTSLFGQNGFGRELGFFTGQTVNLFSSSGLAKELGLFVGQTVTVLGNLVQNKAFGYSSTSMLQAFSSNGFGRELLFLSPQTVNLFGNGLFAKELLFQSSGLVTLNWMGSMTKSIPLVVSEFLLSGLNQISGSLDFTKELGFSQSQFVSMFDNGLVGQEHGYFMFQSVNLLGVNTIGKELGFRMSQSLLVFGDMIFARSLQFLVFECNGVVQLYSNAAYTVPPVIIRVLATGWFLLGFCVCFGVGFPFLGYFMLVKKRGKNGKIFKG